VHTAAEVMAPLLSWTRSRTQDEYDRFEARLKRDHRYQLG